MPLTAGDKLGPYDIISLIGKGGMGEVYSAHDSRTGRDVAAEVSGEHRVHPDGADAHHHFDELADRAQEVAL